MKRSFLVFMLLLLPLCYSAAEDSDGYIDLAELAAETGSELRYDYWKGVYELRKGSRSARFSAGSPFCLIGYTELKGGLEFKADGGRFPAVRRFRR